MLAVVQSAAVLGVDAYRVDCEVDLADGLPTFQTVGLPDAAVKESKDRVKSAITNSQYAFPMQRITVNLAPADIKKEGPAFDLPIALGLLGATGVFPLRTLESLWAVGELALDGRVRPVRGVLSMVLAARKEKVKTFFVPAANAKEAAVVSGASIRPIRTLREAVEFLQGRRDLPEVQEDAAALLSQTNPYRVDFSDVKGQEHAKRALEIAAAGGHNILLIGPPGSGKTMLAKRLPTILPPLTLEEALEVTQVHSIAGLLGRKALLTARPFRAPHHTISDAGLVGGGTLPRPGEVSLAHHGVLFLDELPEFNKNVLEVLRQPLEEGTVTISRVQSALTFPARFMLAAAMNPCPCGYASDPTRTCTCTPVRIQRYLAKISGPLLDRIDLHIEVPALKWKEMSAPKTGESSAAIRERVLAAREIQNRRFQNEEQIFCNAQMGPKQLREYCGLDEPSHALLQAATEKLGLSARAFDRILKVARTIADLDGQNTIAPNHIAEAIGYRNLDRSIWRGEAAVF